MNFKLNNGLLSIEVAEHGAELQSLKHGENEYLWQGNPEFWGRRSPVLFPIVGRTWNDSFELDGMRYSLGQHGFARDCDFTLIEQSEKQLLFELRSDEHTRKNFPRDFILHISYTLEGNRLIVGWEVTNPSDTQTLPFQIGAHPAFNLPYFESSNYERGYFRFPNRRELAYIIPKEKGCSAPGEITLSLPAERTLTITPDTFAHDTFIFENSQLSCIELLTRQGKPWLAVEFDAPLVALWSPTAKRPDCPFICIEPWYGRCDHAGYEGRFEAREWINLLQPGETFTCHYAIRIDL